MDRAPDTLSDTCHKARQSAESNPVRAVCTRDPELAPITVRAGHDAARERALDDVAPDAGRPVAAVQPAMDDVELDQGRVERDEPVGHGSSYALGGAHAKGQPL